MKNLFQLVRSFTGKAISRSSALLRDLKGKSVAKIGPWLTKNKWWIKSFAVPGAAGALGAVAVDHFIQNSVSNWSNAKEDSFQELMTDVGVSNPDKLSRAYHNQLHSKLSEKVDQMTSYRLSNLSPQEQMVVMLDAVQNLALIINNYDNDAVRRVAKQGLISMSAFIQVGELPEEDLSSPLIVRSLRNLSEDMADDIQVESALCTMMNLAVDGTPFRTI